MALKSINQLCISNCPILSFPDNCYHAEHMHIPEVSQSILKKIMDFITKLKLSPLQKFILILVLS